MREVAQTLEEMVRWVEEAGRLEEVGRSLSSLPTQQLAQMAAEAGPSASGEGACPKEAPPYCWRQGPMEGVPEGRERSKSPGSTSLAQLPSARSGGIRRVLNSLFRSSPSHG